MRNEPVSPACFDRLAWLLELRERTKILVRRAVLAILRQAVRVTIICEGDTHMEVGQSLRATLVFRDRLNRVTTVSGVPQWAVSDPAILEVLPDADGLAATVRAVGRTGGASVQATFQTLSDTDTITVTRAGAVSLTISLGEPVD